MNEPLHSALQGPKASPPPCNEKSEYGLYRSILIHFSTQESFWIGITSIKNHNSLFLLVYNSI